MADLVINTGNLMTAPPTGRVQRTPKHTFYTETRPYTITPFVIAPVLAAETLSSVWMEVRQVTQPIKNPILGWTSEFYVFYVKLRDLNNRAIFETMLLDPTASVTDAMDEAADVRYYHRAGQPNYAKQCLRRVVETYFRDTDEAWDVATIDQYPVAQIKDHGWMDSLTDATLLGAGADPGTATDMQDLDKMYSAYEYLRAMQLTDMTFEQYIGTFGVRLTAAEVHKPELIAHWRDFTYPSNTIDPLTGNPSSACSWAFKESNRKPIFFREPGFIFGVQVQRPKLYLAREYSHLVDFLDNGLLWLPAILSDRPETSLREFTGAGAGNGPLSNGTQGPTNGYWVDMRDLFLYGDQFTNITVADLGDKANGVALPNAALNRRYISQNDANFLFVESTKNFTRTDGVITLSIKGAQIDYTGSHTARA